jgi:hypothetical protein
MQSDSTKSACLLSLRVLRRASRPQVLDCPVKRLPRDKHCRRKPVREGEAGTQR